MGRPEVLSPIAQNTSTTIRTAPDQIGADKDRTPASAALTGKQSKARDSGMQPDDTRRSESSTGDNGLHAPRGNRRRLMDRYRTGLRPDNHLQRGAAAKNTAERHSTAMEAHSSEKAAEWTHAHPPPRTRRTASGLVGPAEAENEDAEMSTTPMAADKRGKEADAALGECRFEGSGPSSSTKTTLMTTRRSSRSEAVPDSSTSSASSASLQSTTSGEMYEHAPSRLNARASTSESIKRRTANSRTCETDDVMRTPTLHRQSSIPQHRAGQVPLQRLGSNRPFGVEQLQGESKQLQQQHLGIDQEHLPQSPPSDAQARRRKTRQAFVEIFSPMRAMRVAKAGMKRKYGDGLRRPGTVAQHKKSDTHAEETEASVSAQQTAGLPIDGSSTNAEATFAKRRGEADSRQANSNRHPSTARKISSDISSTHLRRNMRALRLSDRDEASGVAMIRKGSSGRSTRTSSRASSYQRQASAGSSSRGIRSRATSGRAQGKGDISQERRPGDEDATETALVDDAIDCEDDAEIQRLVSHAPSWQLNRLNKTQLQMLHVKLGTWHAVDDVDLDIFSKQDLVEGIIKSRSIEAKPATPSSASTSFTGTSFNTSVRSRRRSSAALSHSVTLSSLTSSQSSEYTDDSNEDDDKTDEAGIGAETDANDAAGEETEVEPANLRRRTARAQPNAAASPILHRLRHAHSRYKLHAHQSYANSSASASTSRLASTKQQPRTAYVATSPAKRRLKHQASVVFAASSPVPTRAFKHMQSSATSRRTSGSATRAPRHHQQRTLRANANGELIVGDITYLPPQRQRRLNKQAGVASMPRGVRMGQPQAVEKDFADESSQDDRDEASEEDEQPSDQHAWEDDSPLGSWRVTPATKSRPPPRRAKIHAQRQLHQASSAAEDSEALVEEALGNRVYEQDDEDNMSMSEQSTDADTQRPPHSDMSLDDLDEDDTVTAFDGVSREGVEEEEDEEEEEEESDLSDLETPSESEVQASPSKIRRLRNGKVRYPTTPLAEKSQAAAQLVADEADTDMKRISRPELSSSSLSKLRRDDLIQLCSELDVAYSNDATRAMLIDALLAQDCQRPPDSAQTTRPTDSNASARTARQSDTESNTKPQRGARAKTGSSTPLLLRSGSLPAQSEKPGTPVPSQQGEEELNGLDLESLDLVDKEIPFSKLEKMEKIGSGGFKDVYIGKYHISKKTSKKVAICDIRDQLSEMDIKELTLLRDLKHENIVRFIGVSIPPPEMRLTPCIIVSELCSNGDLYDYIRNTQPPEDHDIFRILLETARGLEYLHTRKPAIIHRDCKSTNVLVTRNKTAKINDFGLARVRNNKRSMIKSLVGTVNWQAVELWQPKPSYDEKIDVWSAGMTFWETLQWHQPEKKYPFQDMNEHQIYQDVGQRKLRPPTISIRRHYGTEIVDLLDRMWDHNPKERPTMTEVCSELETLVAMKREAADEKAAAAAAMGSDGVLDTAGRRSSNANGLRKASR